MAEAHRMIEPFNPSQVAEGMISYGLSSYGYDLRVADDFKIFSPPNGVTLNPKSIPPEYYRDHHGQFCDIPPNGYVLGRTVTGAVDDAAILRPWRPSTVARHTMTNRLEKPAMT